MGVFQSIGSTAVPKDLLCDFDSGSFVQMGGGRMPEQPGVELLVDGELIGRSAEDVLQSTWRDALFTLGEQKRPFFPAPQFQIDSNDFANTVGQHEAPVPSSLFPDPDQAACNVNIIDIQCGQGLGPEAEGAQQHDDDEIPQPHH